MSSPKRRSNPAGGKKSMNNVSTFDIQPVMHTTSGSEMEIE